MLIKETVPESQPESSIVDTPHTKMEIEGTIKSNYFPVRGRFYFTFPHGASEHRQIIFAQHLFAKELIISRSVIVSGII